MYSIKELNGAATEQTYAIGVAPVYWAFWFLASSPLRQ